jgi:iron complex outermembrane recepter protein
MKQLLLCLILLATTSLAVAQTVTGRVTSEADGAALPGVSVVVKGTSNGTTTNADGDYTIDVRSGDAVLVFSFIGFSSQEIPVQNRSTINVGMVEDITQLNEVVVTGFGEKKEIGRIAFAVQDVGGEELVRATNANVVNALQGKIAGVQIDQGTGGPMSSSRIRIRGNSSLSSNTQPLVVIDGVLIRPTVTGADSWGAAQDNGNIMKNINPDNIESMTVLKGSAASALYGSDALNGVIIITTKRGVERKGVGVTLSHTTSFERAYRFLDVQNEFGAGIRPEFVVGSDGVEEVDRANPFYSYGPRFDGRMVRDLDGRMIPWEANDPLSFYETGKFSNNNVVVEGGNDRSSFRASYSNLTNSTIMPSGTKMTRNNFSVRATQKIGELFDLNAVVDYTHNFIENPIRQGGNFNPVFRMVYYRPRSLDMDYWMKNYRDPVNGGARTGVNDPYNVGAFLWDTFEDISERTESVFRTNLDITTHIRPWLTFLVRGNIQNELYKGERRRLGNQPRFAGGQFNQSTSDSWQYRIQSLLTANKQLNDDLFLSITLGGETNKLNGGRFYRVFTRNAGGGEDNSLKVPGVFSIANSINSPGIETRLNPSRLKNAVYLYGDLTYRDMLTFNFSYRTDYSSTLAYADGSGDFSYSYPAVGLAWTFTESFGNLPGWLTTGKLRTNFGITGGDTEPWIINETGSYTNRGDYFFPGGSLNYSNFRDNTLPNKSLKNREAREWEVGTDLRFLSDRIGLDFTYYNKVSSNEIFSLPVASEAGVSSRIVNGGKIENKGVEIILRATPISTNDFRWNTLFNFTRNRNKVLELPEGVASQQLSLAFGADVYSMAKPGLEYATIATPYAFATYQKRDSEGNPVDHPSNGERVIGAASGTAGYLTYLRSGAYGQDAKELGSAMEKFLLTTINTFSYKNFTLNIQLDAKIGGMMASATHQYGTSNGSLKNSLFGRDAEHGGLQYTADNGEVRNDGIVPEGVLADGIKSIIDPNMDLGGMSYADAVAAGHLKPIPARNYYENLTQWSSGIREYSVFENSWVSLREVSLGYDVPASFISKVKLQTLRISLIGRNITYLYRTAKDGINPEGLKSNAAGEFSEYGGLPFTRQMGFSLTAGF